MREGERRSKKWGRNFVGRSTVTVVVVVDIFCATEVKKVSDFGLR